MKSFFILALVLIFSNIANAHRAPKIKWQIEGNISTLDNKPVRKAKIFIFFDNEESTLAKSYLTIYPDYFITDNYGDFKATVYYKSMLLDTVQIIPKSGVLSEETKRNDSLVIMIPDKIEIVIIKKGYKTTRKIFNLGEYRVNIGKYEINENMFKVDGFDAELEKPKYIKLPKIVSDSLP